MTPIGTVCPGKEIPESKIASVIAKMRRRICVRSLREKCIISLGGASAKALVLCTNDCWQLLHKGKRYLSEARAVRKDGSRQNKEQQGRIESSAPDGALHELFRAPALPAHSRRNTLRNIAVTLWIAFLPSSALAQKTVPPTPAQVAREVRDYRMANEDRIVREL